MTALRRRLFSLVSLASLILLVVAVVIWANSFSREETVYWVRAAVWQDTGWSIPPLGNSEWSLGVGGGQMHVIHHYPAVGAPAPGFRHEGHGYYASDAKWFSFRSGGRWGDAEFLEMDFPLAIVIVLLATLPLSTWMRRWHDRRIRLD